MKKKKWIIWGSILIVIAGAVILLVVMNRKQWSFNTAVVRTQTVETTVMSTGYIQPVEEVEVGTQVSGVIEKIYVDYNSVVTAGQLLAELDKSTLNEMLIQANAALSTAQSNLLFAEQNYNRVRRLHEVKAATDVSLEEAVNRFETAKRALEDAQANANQAAVNLGYADIYSPINGVILDRQVNEGQTVASSFSTPTLFTIAEDLTKMQVEVDADEADIGQIRLGQTAQFTVDAYPYDQFSGTVRQIRLQPIETNNVITYTVIVEAPNPDLKLFPGMTANITIQVQSETGPAVPNEALSFRMTPEMGRQVNIPEESIAAAASRPQAQNQTRNLALAANGQGPRMVWVKTGDSFESRRIETGITDGIHTIVTSGLNEGDEVVLSAALGKQKSSKEATRNPLMPTPIRR